MMNGMMGYFRAVGGVGRYLILGACGLLLAGCVSETSVVEIRPAKGVSAERALEDFVILAGTADFIGENCRSYGIRKNYRSADQLIASYARGLERQGYSQQELAEAIDGFSYDAVVDKAVARLAAGGAREGDLGSICRLGLKEISAGTPLGRLLRS
jgi:Family of unknown function (DUF5333)